MKEADFAPFLLHGSSARLRFAPLLAQHALSLSPALLDPEVYTFIKSGPPESTEAFAAQIERKRAGPQAPGATERWVNVAVFSIDGNRAVGRLEATITAHRAEIAYLFGRDHWGKGYAQEGMLWLQDRLRERGVTGLWATVLPTNARSVRLLHRLGFQEVDHNWPELGSYDEGDLVFCRLTDDPPILREGSLAANPRIEVPA